MKLLLDTHLLLWAGAYPERLSADATELLEDGENELLFSSASIWEIAIKFSLGRESFMVEPGELRREFLTNDFRELPVFGEHAVAVATLPPIHKDPFDRLLIAQSIVEGITLLSADALIARYPAPIRLV
jgi:PIN domain nuclease of toxin-antitoxin system